MRQKECTQYTTFAFSEKRNFDDIVEQFSDGKVTLWSENNNGSRDSRSTCTCGENSVTVSGNVQVSLKFGAGDVYRVPGYAFADCGTPGSFADPDGMPA